jgi:hypothetical protein
MGNETPGICGLYEEKKITYTVFGGETWDKKTTRMTSAEMRG